MPMYECDRCNDFLCYVNDLEARINEMEAKVKARTDLLRKASDLLGIAASYEPGDWPTLGLKSHCRDAKIWVFEFERLKL